MLSYGIKHIPIFQVGLNKRSSLLSYGIKHIPIFQVGLNVIIWHKTYTNFSGWVE